jgi:hypothetical protein
MKLIGYFDISMFWLAVLLVVTITMHSSNNIVFEDKSVLMENITNHDAGFGGVAGHDCYGEVQSGPGVKAVLTSDGFSDNGSVNCCSTRIPFMYSVTESGRVLIVY